MSWFQTPDCVDKLKAHTHRIALLCGTLGRIQAEMKKNLVDENKFMGSINSFGLKTPYMFYNMLLTVDASMLPPNHTA